MFPDQPQQPTTPAPVPTAASAAPQQPAVAPPEPRQPTMHNPLAVMQPGESVLCEIKRHPIGIFGIYVMSGFVLIVLAVLAFVVAPKVLTNYASGDIMGLGALVFFVFALLTLGFVFISNKIYWGNSWILTSDSLTQVTQSSLFNKQSSQLSLGNLEDVTAEQNGILTHIFKYGVLKVETAGEHSKFAFLFCPNPTYYAQCVLHAREVFERGEQYGPKSGDGVNVNTQQSV